MSSLRVVVTACWLLCALLFWKTDLRTCILVGAEDMMSPLVASFLAFAALTWLTWRSIPFRVLGGALSALSFLAVAVFLKGVWSHQGPLGECDIHGDENIFILSMVLRGLMTNLWAMLALSALILAVGNWRERRSARRKAETRYCE